MKFLSTVILLLLFCVKLFAQPELNEFATIMVNKQVKNCVNEFDLSTPLNSYIYFTYLNIDGRKDMEKALSSYRIRGFMSNSKTAKNPLSEEKKKLLLNMIIKEVIVFKDSIAGVITNYTDSIYIIRYFSLEEHKWLNAGADFSYSLVDAREKFIKNSTNFLMFSHKINELKIIHSDTSAFSTYLNLNAQNPKQFILNALQSHKVVIYGEVHKRKSSWDLMKQVIQDTAFYKSTGTIFMELSSDKQPVLNQFFMSKKMDPELILNILREVQLNGWPDKGMYEFILELWRLNNSLSEENKIQVIAADIPRPFNSLKTLKDYDSFFENVKDRNEQMADIIEQTLQATSDKRNCLFIVGMAHANKSPVPAIASGKYKSQPSAAFLLSERLSQKEVFSIITHSPIISNDGTVHGKIRGGIFDYIFSEMQNKPIAFFLHDSPFGKEPFDAIYEISYDKKVGDFEYNYDGYFFLEPLNEEENEYFLYELYTDEFILEIKRRANMMGSDDGKWFHTFIQSLSKEEFKNNSLKKGKRWNMDDFVSEF